MKVELIHDSLAKNIYDRASHDDKMLLNIATFIKERQSYYQDEDVLLSQKDLDYIDPYEERLLLETTTQNFIEKSKSKIVEARKRRRFLVGIFLFILFAILCYIFYYNMELKATKKSIFEAERNIQSELAYQKKKQKEIDSLTQLTVETNSINLFDTSYVQNLIQSYDSLQLASKQIREERKIAQSTTLSSLGAIAFENNNTEKSFELTAKAWQLNPQNKQAIQLLEQIALSDGLIDAYTATVPTAKLIQLEATKKNRQPLSEAAMAAIFEEENKISIQIHRTLPTTPNR